MRRCLLPGRPRNADVLTPAAVDDLSGHASAGHPSARLLVLGSAAVAHTIGLMVLRAVDDPTNYLHIVSPLRAPRRRRLVPIPSGGQEALKYWFSPRRKLTPTWRVSIYRGSRAFLFMTDRGCFVAGPRVDGLVDARDEVNGVISSSKMASWLAFRPSRWPRRG